MSCHTFGRLKGIKVGKFGCVDGFGMGMNNGCGELFYFCHCVGRWGRLLRCKGAECHSHCAVDTSGIV